MSGATSEEKRRLVRFAILIGILLLAIYALFDLADRLEIAKEHNQATKTAAETDG